MQSSESGQAGLPLDGFLVVDVTRMLPGAVAARSLIDQGARLIKIEAPGVGDLMRGAGPRRGGMSVGFAHYFRGAESLPLDLRNEGDRTVLRQLIARADVFMESFRPGTLTRWGMDPQQLRQDHPRLVTCSLPGYASGADDPAAVVGHDLNFTAATGLLSLLPGAIGTSGDPGDIPGIQIADVTAGLLAASAIGSALLKRERFGEGSHVEQPLVSGPLPFAAWGIVDTVQDGPDHMGVSRTMLAGKVPCYRCYRCGDGRWISVGCLEPKFWVTLTQRLGVPHLAPLGLAAGEREEKTAAEVTEAFAQADLATWLERLSADELPVGPVLSVDEAHTSGALTRTGLMEQTPMPDGTTLLGPGPALPSVSRTPTTPAPKLGEHAEALRAEFAASDENEAD